eukprot:10925140-Alexandrium_andersonii.AAC.1
MVTPRTPPAGTATDKVTSSPGLLTTRANSPSTISKSTASLRTRSRSSFATILPSACSPFSR